MVLSRDAVYFTNSTIPYFYKIPLGPGGALHTPIKFETMPMTGDWQQGTGFGANGIDPRRTGAT